jgi:hypothetical protein
MRILTIIAISVGILLSGITEAQPGQSSAVSSQEEKCSITRRVTIDNRGAPSVVIALQLATGSWPLPPPVARATTDQEGQFHIRNAPAGRYYLVPLAPAFFAPSEDRMIASGKPHAGEGRKYRVD